MSEMYPDTNYAGYASGAHQATQATVALNAAVAQLTQGSAAASAVFNRLIPAAGLVGLGKFAAAAGDAQQQLAQLRAGTIATASSFTALAGASTQLARQFPIGSRGARELVGEIQSMGVQADKHSQNVLKLGQAFTQLSAASGESTGAVAQNVANLARSFGDQNLSPRRITQLSDSLITLKNQFGGSVSGITSFANAISPFARQMGIGAQATLGIAASFSRLGADSGAAANAVAKVMSDLTRATRDGGPQLAKYASLVGMTAGSFRQMADANPTKTLTSVVRALGTPGVAAQRAMEDLGFDSIRVQRPLIQLAQSGGLESTIAASVNAQPGTAARAAETAMHGFNDSLSRLSSSSSQLAEQFGAPMLQPLTQFTDALRAGVNVVSHIVGLIPGPVLTGLGYAGAGIGLAKLAGKTALVGGIADTLYNSETVRAARGGRLQQRRGMSLEDLEAEYSGALADPNLGRGDTRRARSRLAAVQAAQRAAAGVGEGFDASMATRSYGAATGFYGQAAPPGTGFLGNLQATMRVGAYGVNRMMATTDNLVAPGSDTGNRTSLFRDLGKAMEGSIPSIRRRAAADDEAAKATKSLKETASGVSRAFGDFFAQAGSTSVGGSLAGAAGRRAGALGNAATRLGRAGAGLAAEGLEGLTGIAAANPLALAGTAALAGGMFLYQDYQRTRQQRQQNAADFQSATLSQNYDILRAARGLGPQSSTTIGDVAPGRPTPQGPNLSELARVGVSGGLAYNRKDKAGAIALIRAQYAGGLSDEDRGILQAQLRYRGFSDQDANEVISKASPGSAPVDFRSAGQAVTQGQSQRFNGKQMFIGRFAGTGKGTQRQLESLVASIDEQYERDRNAYGEDYAAGKRAQAAQALLAGVNSSDVTGEHAGSARRAVRNAAQDLVKGYLGAPVVAKPADTPGRYYDDLGVSGVGGRFQGLFDQRGRGGKSLVETITGVSQADAQSQGKATRASNDAGLKAGLSLNQLSISASRAAAVTGDPTRQLAYRQAAATAGQIAVLQSTSAGQASGLQATQFLAQAIGAPGQAQDEEGRQAALQGLLGSLQQQKALYQQRIMAQIQYQTASARAQQDFATNMARGEQDFYISRARANRDFNKQMRRQAEDGAKTLYDPYRRIQVEPLFDAASLRVNMSNQIGAMRKQVANLRRARRAGLSNATIQMLDLANPAHAQQLEELLDTMSSGDVRGLNTQTQQRTSLAGQLLTDSGNTQYVRSRQDFQQSLKDQNTDFQRANDRAAADFAKSQRRMAQDLHNSFLSVTTDWKLLQGNLNTNMSATSARAKGVLVDDLGTYNTNLAHALGTTKVNMAALWNSVVMLTTPGGAGSTIEISLDKNGNPVLKINGKRVSSSTPSTPIERDRHGQIVAGGSGTTSLSGSQFSLSGPAPAPTSNPAPQVAPPPPGGAAGGLFVHGATRLTAGEVGPEALIPLGTSAGNAVLAAIRRYMGDPDDYRQHRANGGRTYISVHNGNNVYDHSVTVEKVESNADPDKLIGTFREMQTRANLTAPSTRKVSA